MLTVNAGSSSVKLAAFAWKDGTLRRLAADKLENPDQPADVTFSRFVVDNSLPAIDVISHRVVHGGSTLQASCLITSAVEKEIAEASTLAPLHNPIALAWLRAARRAFSPAATHVAVFDTAFFSRLPAVASTYALPHDLCHQHGIRRYGFHGIAHEAMWRAWCVFSGTDGDGARLITLQLGAGCSVSVIESGVARDTSMGFTPLEGLVMSTRSGDVDPGLLMFLQRRCGLTLDQLEHMLSNESGLLGVSQRSGDIRELLGRNDPDSELAVDLFCYRARKYIGAYLAVLGGADAIILGGGIGENSPEIRARILSGMAWCGIELDPKANRGAIAREARISQADSPVEVWVVPVDEESILADEAFSLLRQQSETSKGTEDMEEVDSARRTPTA